jgi:hypothetical protein
VVAAKNDEPRRVEAPDTRRQTIWASARTCRAVPSARTANPITKPVLSAFRHSSAEVPEREIIDDDPRASRSVRTAQGLQKYPANRIF